MAKTLTTGQFGEMGSQDGRTYIEHAQFGLVGLLLAGACAGRFAVVFPGLPVPLPAASRAIAAITHLLTRRYV